MNIGYFMFNISKALMNLGQKLYDLWTMEISIEWVQKILSFFGASVELPNNISLSWILGSASAAVILVLIVYRIFK